MSINSLLLGVYLVNKQVKATIGLIIILITMLAMAETVITQVEEAMSGDDTWNFTGAEGASALVGLVPLVYYASILLVAVAGAFAISKME